ncbi:GIY-YIG nuclease family protein [Algoriphagus sp. SE2]|uniref:GIY-YIG nuclease family protein n=1 Tax=Algoriphagus sp. SE2 TaxID=3141536 RepID=UPI0031CD214E
MQKGGAVYIMANARNTVLYTGVTNDLFRRISEHRNGLNPNAFTSKYNLIKIVYFESFNSIEEGIIREKQIKGRSRKKKEELINSINPEWKDLWNDIKEW